MLAYRDSIDDPAELRALSSWKPRTLTDDRKGAWSLSFTANPCLIFRIDSARSRP